MNEDDVFAGLQHQMELEEMQWRESEDFCAYVNIKAAEAAEETVW